MIAFYRYRNTIPAISHKEPSLTMPDEGQVGEGVSDKYFCLVNVLLVGLFVQNKTIPMYGYISLQFSPLQNVTKRDWVIRISQLRTK